MIASGSKLTPAVFDRPEFPSGWSSISLSPANLSLANTLPIGQSFLWHRTQLAPSASKREVKIEESIQDVEQEPVEEFSRAITNPPRVLLLRQSSTKLYYTTLVPGALGNADAIRQQTLDFIDDYFQLSRFPSLPAMYEDWRVRDPGLFGRLDVESDPRALGIRVLRQDVWECLIS